MEETPSSLSSGQTYRCIRAVQVKLSEYGLSDSESWPQQDLSISDQQSWLSTELRLSLGRCHTGRVDKNDLVHFPQFKKLVFINVIS